MEYLQSLLESKKGNQYIVPLVPLFSGGIHDVQLGGSMQQIMIGVSGLDFRETVYVICSVYQKVEHFLIEKNLFKGLAASSGFLVKSLSIENEFAFIRKIIDESEWNNHLFLAVDVAAEHLRVNGNYRFYNQIYSPDEFEELLYSFIKKYSISIVEDPFHYSDVGNWNSLYKRTRNRAEILSDDYSATQIQYLDSNILDGAIIKMKQVGTLSATLQLVSKIKKLGLKTCVSHRSCETEDTFICDLAVAIGSDYIKIGAPNRGDRVEKYNQLLRLYGLSL